MAKYGKKASKSVESAMRRRKKGTLKSSSGQTVKSRKQAIAIGLSEAREKGAKVPSKTSAQRKSARSTERKSGSTSAKRKRAGSSGRGRAKSTTRRSRRT
jgi:hypothetical protein